MKKIIKINSGGNMISLEQIKENSEVNGFIEAVQKQLNALGYTEHSYRHISIVSQRAGKILEVLRL